MTEIIDIWPHSKLSGLSLNLQPACFSSTLCAIPFPLFVISDLVYMYIFERTATCPQARLMLLVIFCIENYMALEVMPFS